MPDRRPLGPEGPLASHIRDEGSAEDDTRGKGGSDHVLGLGLLLPGGECRGGR